MEAGAGGGGPGDEEEEGEVIPPPPPPPSPPMARVGTASVVASPVVDCGGCCVGTGGHERGGPCDGVEDEGGEAGEGRVRPKRGMACKPNYTPTIAQQIQVQLLWMGLSGIAKMKGLEMKGGLSKTNSKNKRRGSIVSSPPQRTPPFNDIKGAR